MDIMKNTTRIITAWELYQQDMSKIHIARYLGRHRETIHLWIKEIEEIGLKEYLEKYENAKKGERKGRQIKPTIKKRIWEIRKEENDCCGQKIQYYLKKETGIKVSVPKIYEILKEKFKIRSKWKKNTKRGHTPKACKPREVIQMDTVDFGDMYAFTGIDIFTREIDIFLAPELKARYGRKFLIQSMRRRFDNFSELIQTDGGSEFKEDFKATVKRYCNRHRIARPYKKNEQSYIESFNRTLRKECLGWKKYRQGDIESCKIKVEKFIYKYHNTRPHMGLDMKTPLDVKKDCRIFK
jgi:transposase